jgi:phage/plasmid-associated DNA primase
MKLYEDYKDYCQESGNQTKSKNKFSDELLEVCQSLQWGVVKRKTKYGRFICGVKLMPRGCYSDFSSQKDDLSEVLNNTRVTTLVTT